jgi:hypothetical protein
MWLGQEIFFICSLIQRRNADDDIGSVFVLVSKTLDNGISPVHIGLLGVPSPNEV